MIILDEPTSSLDNETESEVLSGVAANSKDKIIFIVSHKHENLKYCTRVVKIENNKLLEVGSELWKNSTQSSI